MLQTHPITPLQYCLPSTIHGQLLNLLVMRVFSFLCLPTSGVGILLLTSATGNSRLLLDDPLPLEVSSSSNAINDNSQDEFDRLFGVRFMLVFRFMKANFPVLFILSPECFSTLPQFSKTNHSHS